MTPNTLSSPFFSFECLLPAIGCVQFNIWMILGGCSDTAAVWGPGEQPKNEDNGWRTLTQPDIFQPDMATHTWKRLNLLEHIIRDDHFPVDCIRHSADMQQSGLPIAVLLKTHSAMHAACFSNGLWWKCTGGEAARLLAIAIVWVSFVC